MNHQVLNQTLKQLRLSGLLQTLPVRLQEAAANRLSHADFLELIVQDELAVRQERVLKRLTKAADVFFVGPPCVGKTHLAQAIGYEAIKMNFHVLYRSIFDLVNDFLKDEAFSQMERTVRKYLKPDLVIIDDMGLKSLPKHSAEYLLEVIMRRYENRSTIMTSNRPLEEWGKLLGDVPSASAILDRFLHHAQTIAIA